MTEIDNILDFWIGPLPETSSFPMEKATLWWKPKEELDNTIRQKFEKDLLDANQGKLDHWQETARGCLALIILFDQFSRNIYRGTPKAFAQDAKARNICFLILEREFDKKLHDVEKWFIYMPLMHSEKLEDQKRSLELFRQLVDRTVPALEVPLGQAYEFAVRHHDIVAQFGKFPHRNKILNRPSTPAEVEFLKQPGSSF